MAHAARRSVSAAGAPTATGEFFDRSERGGDAEAMLEATEEARVFESMKDDLLRSHAGGFAVICAGRLVGIFRSIDEALLTTCGVFDDGAIPAGAPILISEIAQNVSVRVMATPARGEPVPVASASVL
jgi:hypothetical protein